MHKAMNSGVSDTVSHNGRVEKKPQVCAPQSAALPLRHPAELTGTDKWHRVDIALMKSTLRLSHCY